MKKAMGIVFLLMLVCVFAFSSCDKFDISPHDNDNHQSTEDKENSNNGEEKNEDSSNNSALCQHTFGDWNTVKQATCKEEGKRTRTCQKCSDLQEEKIQKVETHSPGKKSDGIVSCLICNKTLEDNRLYTITFKCGTKTLKTERLKVGATVTAPTLGSNKWYVWDNAIPEKMPDKNIIVSASAIGGNAWANTTWEYDLKGTLSIHGKGNMSNFSEESQPWSEFKTEITAIVFDNTITGIGKYAFFGCTSLIKVVIPDSIVTIGDYAFANCDSIREITIGANVTSIGTGAFVSSYDLEAVTIKGKLNWRVKIDNYYNDITFSYQNKYSNAAIFKEYIQGKFTAY